jgi:hypothetical protein
MSVLTQAPSDVISWFDSHVFNPHHASGAMRAAASNGVNDHIAAQTEWTKQFHSPSMMFHPTGSFPVGGVSKIK